MSAHLPPVLGIKAALIDLDGTLLDTAPDIAFAVNAMLADFGMPALSEDRVAGFVGKGAEILVHRAITNDPQGQLDEPTFDRGITSFRHHYMACNGKHVRWYPQVREGLAAMQQAGLQLACVTNKPRDFTVPLLELTGLAPWFGAVIAGGDTRHKKPHPDPYLAGAAALGFDPANTVAIGDSHNDAVSARAAGCAVLLLPYGYNEGAPIEASDCDAIVPDLLMAARWIVARNQQLNA